MSENIYKTLRAGGLSHVGACALMGNLEAESGLKSNNLQNSFEKSGVSDEVYTLAVDNGLYKNFAADQAGYGLAQWTHPDRKRKLLNFVKEANASIGDETTQIEFAIHELKTEYSGLFNYLCSVGADGLYAATDRICREYERPAVNNVAARYAFAQKWDKYFTLNGIADLDTETAKPATPTVPEVDKLDEILGELAGMKTYLELIYAKLEA